MLFRSPLLSVLVPSPPSSPLLTSPLPRVAPLTAPPPFLCSAPSCSPAPPSIAWWTTSRERPRSRRIRYGVVPKGVRVCMCACVCVCVCVCACVCTPALLVSSSNWRCVTGPRGGHCGRRARAGSRQRETGLPLSPSPSHSFLSPLPPFPFHFLSFLPPFLRFSLSFSLSVSLSVSLALSLYR